MTNQIIPSASPNPVCEQVPPDRPEALDVEWCAERASEALKYLATNYPEAAGSPELHPHQDDAHEAAVERDAGAYLEALRRYMRAGRSVALQVRKGAA